MCDQCHIVACHYRNFFYLLTDFLLVRRRRVSHYPFCTGKCGVRSINIVYLLLRFLCFDCFCFAFMARAKFRLNNHSVVFALLQHFVYANE